jgi:hypothetical protein
MFDGVRIEPEMRQQCLAGGYGRLGRPRGTPLWSLSNMSASVVEIATVKEALPWI